MIQDNDPLRPHAHEPNPEPPTADPTFTLSLPDGVAIHIGPADLQKLKATTIGDCYIISTGHGSSGPFTFTGVTLLDFLRHYINPPRDWSQVEVISADGFGTRLDIEELTHPDPAGPPLLSYAVNGRSLSRDDGLVRLIVPNEKDDALRQVKWIGQINVRH